MSFFKISDILNKARSKHSAFGQRMDEAKALGRWEEAVGALISKHSRAVSVRNQILWVEVDHSIWRSELHYRKNQILQILNRDAKSETQQVIKDIFFIDPKKRAKTLRFPQS